VAAVKDLEEVVDHATTELDRLIKLGQLEKDPLRYPLDGLGVVLRAQVAVVDEMRAAALPAAAPMTDAQADAAGRRIAQAGVAHLAGVVRNEFRKGWGIAVGSAAMLLVVGIGIGWLLWGRAPGLTCEDQRGGRVCWVWTVPPR
jgi:hypothetical protein